MQLSVLKTSVYDLLRKQYNSEIARMVIAYWRDYQIDDPLDVEEAIFFYLFGGIAIMASFLTPN